LDAILEGVVAKTSKSEDSHLVVLIPIQHVEKVALGTGLALSQP
jgi:hypothetical protein